MYMYHGFKLRTSEPLVDTIWIGITLYTIGNWIHTTIPVRPHFLLVVGATILDPSQATVDFRSILLDSECLIHITCVPLILPIVLTVSRYIDKYRQILTIFAKQCQCFYKNTHVSKRHVVKKCLQQAWNVASMAWGAPNAPFQKKVCRCWNGKQTPAALNDS